MENANEDVKSYGRVELDQKLVLSSLRKDVDVGELQLGERGSYNVHN